MAVYFIKRLLLALPVLWVISLLAFGMSRFLPGDEVDIRSGFYFSQNTSATSELEIEKDYQKFSHEFGLDLPWFYFSLTTAIYPDTFFKIVQPEKRRVATALLEKSANWSAVQDWLNTLKLVRFQLENIPDSIDFNTKIALHKNLQNLLLSTDFAEMDAFLKENRLFIQKNKVFDFLERADLSEKLRQISTQKNNYNSWLPAVFWHGTDNQYHRWLKSFVVGTGEKSRIDGRPVRERIAEMLPNTLALSGISLILSYFLAIFLGLFSIKNAGKRADHWLQNVLFGVWSMPIFWLATLGVIYLTGMGRPFAGVGLGDVSKESNFCLRILEKMTHFILPILILTIHNLAYLTRQIRQSLENQTTELYFRTTRAKGIPEWQALRKHALPNALFPLVTLFSSILPASIAGSLVIEVLFQIPGMGYLTEQSFHGSDWPVIFAILLMISGVTILGQILADLVFVWLDPRVRF
jgi:peptide/nickel transport system permease protein